MNDDHRPDRPVLILPSSFRESFEAVIASQAPPAGAGSEAMLGWLLARQVEVRYSDFLPPGMAVATGELGEAARELRLGLLTVDFKDIFGPEPPSNSGRMLRQPTR